MAGSLKTTNYQLAKYAPGDITSWLTDFNGNMDLIDGGMQANKQAATQAQDGVNNLEAEYESLLQTVNGHTTSIDANEKAIAANIANIGELEDAVNAITIGDSVLYSESQSNLTKQDSLVNTIAAIIRKVGNEVSGSISIGISSGTLHSYDRVGTGIVANQYLTDIARINGNPLNLPAGEYTVRFFALHENGVDTSSIVNTLLAVGYISSGNYTAISLVSTETAQIKYTNSKVGVANM